MDLFELRGSDAVGTALVGLDVVGEVQFFHAHWERGLPVQDDFGASVRIHRGVINKYYSVR